MRRALEKIAALQGAQRARELEPFLARVEKMEGAGRLFKRIADAGDVDAMDDHLATARYALMFAGLAFEVVVEPTGREGPDLSITRDGQSAVVEVTRFQRELVDPTAEVPKAIPGGLQNYGDPMRYIERRIRDKIMDKFSQLRHGAGVLALWNDDDDLEELETSQEVAELAEEGMAGTLRVPLGLHLVVYASHWVHPGARQQVHCFELQPNCPPYLRQWRADLESSLVRDLMRRAISS